MSDELMWVAERGEPGSPIIETRRLILPHDAELVICQHRSDEAPVNCSIALKTFTWPVNANSLEAVQDIALRRVPGQLREIADAIERFRAGPAIHPEELPLVDKMAGEGAPVSE